MRTAIRHLNGRVENQICHGSDPRRQICGFGIAHRWSSLRPLIAQAFEHVLCGLDRDAARDPVNHDAETAAIVMLLDFCHLRPLAFIARTIPKRYILYITLERGM